ncbi:type II toxin-antitoxin system VapC family toxin [Micrococcales bacterium 31B]|nr:type II toxin-antitoxin system VapC family toxin [Micrococcales bacterium 31B]
MIILDTHVVSECFRSTPEPRVIAWMSSLDNDVAVTAVTLAELLAGVRRLPRGRRRSTLESAIVGAIEPYRRTGSILAFDDAAASEYAAILVERERAGLPIAALDAQIAAICRVHRATCATRNEKDFAHTGVRVVNPWTE